MSIKPLPSIRSRLALLVTVCLLPASLIAVILLSYDYRQGREKLVDNSITTARTIAYLVDKDFVSIEATLRVLATSPSLTTRDLATFYQQAQEVLKTQAVNNIVLTDPSGQQLINTLRPFGERLPRSEDHIQLHRLAETNGPVISGGLTGKVTQQPGISIAVPVHRNGRHVFNLGTVIFPEQFERLILQQHLPPDWITAIVDSGGIIVARSHDMARYVGHHSSQSLTDAMALDNDGFFEGTTSEGIPVLGMFSRSTVTNWGVAIGVPAESLTNELRMTVLWLALAIAVLFASSLGLAWRIGGKIAASIRSLTGPALALGSGKDVNVPPLHVREADEVGKALLKASAMLHQAQHQATHDILTGLANRALFTKILNQQLAISERNGTNLSVLYIDLDGFKAVNDAHGHALGDQLLQQVATRLTSSVRDADLAARLGGDEFAVLLIGASAAIAASIAAELVIILSAPYIVHEVQVCISASIGSASYPEFSNSQLLLSVADGAMYQAKAGGKRQAVSA